MAEATASLPSCRLAEERVSVWVLMHDPDSLHRWGGLDGLRKGELAAVLAQSPSLILLGGEPADVKFLLNMHSSLAAGGWL